MFPLCNRMLKFASSRGPFIVMWVWYLQFFRKSLKISPHKSFVEFTYDGPFNWTEVIVWTNFISGCLHSNQVISIQGSRFGQTKIYASTRTSSAIKLAFLVHLHYSMTSNFFFFLNWHHVGMPFTQTFIEQVRLNLVKWFWRWNRICL